MSIGEAEIIEIHFHARLEHKGGFGRADRHRKTRNPGLTPDPTAPSAPHLLNSSPSAVDVDAASELMLGQPRQDHTQHDPDEAAAEAGQGARVVGGQR